MSSLPEEARRWPTGRRGDFLQYELPGAVVAGVLWKVVTSQSWAEAFSMNHIPVQPTHTAVWLMVTLSSAFVVGFVLRHAVVPFYPRRAARPDSPVRLQALISDARLLRDFLATRRSPDGSRLYTSTIAFRDAEQHIGRAASAKAYGQDPSRALVEGPLASVWNNTMAWARNKSKEPDDAMPLCWLIKALVENTPPQGASVAHDKAREVVDSVIRTLSSDRLGLEETRLIREVPADALEMLVAQVDGGQATMSADRIRSCLNELHGRYLPQSRDQFEPTIERQGLAECMAAATVVAALLLLVPWHKVGLGQGAPQYVRQALLPGIAAAIGSFFFLMISRREYSTLIRNMVRALAVWR